MKLRATLVLGLFVAATSSAWAQTSTTTIQTGDNRLVITGDVVRIEPGKAIVIREKGDKIVTYTLSPSCTVPTDVVVGRTVTLHTELGEGGANVVTRVTTTVTPEGEVQRTTETTRTTPSGTTTTTTTAIVGTVQTYDMGKSITLARPDGTTVTYVINDRSKLPKDLVVGREIEVRTLPGGEDAVIERVTYVKVKKDKIKSKTKEKVIS